MAKKTCDDQVLTGELVEVHGSGHRTGRGQVSAVASYDVVPATVGDAGQKASYRFMEFFTANIRNARN